jgi:Endoplasmic Reticulum-Golgi Intermediate Compartment (ERGIC)
MRVETKSDLIVDRSLHGELLRINFNISFPALSCEFATLDISDALGLKRLNLTKTVRKAPIDGDSLRRSGASMKDTEHQEPEYDAEGEIEKKICFYYIYHYCSCRNFDRF